MNIPDPDPLALRANFDRGLWLRWIAANAAGEMIGLGATAAIVVVSILFTQTAGILMVPVAAGVAVAAGAIIEGTVVGAAQWLVLRRPLPHMRWRSWVLATAAGALAAWTLGMIPSTLANLGADSGAAPPPEMGSATAFALAALMGLVLGPVLGFPQWLVLRRYVHRAFWWVPANAAAWAPAMVVIFAGAGSVPAGGVGPGLVLALLLTLAAAGAVVGAIHGLALIWLLQQKRPSTT